LNNLNLHAETDPPSVKNLKYETPISIMYASVRENTNSRTLTLVVLSVEAPDPFTSFIYSVPGHDMSVPYGRIRKFVTVAQAFSYCTMSVRPNREGANSPPVNDVCIVSTFVLYSFYENT